MVDLSSSLRRALEDWDVVKAETEIKKQESREYLSQHGFDLISLICEYLTPEIEESGPHLTLCCQDLLSVVAKEGNAKELLLAVLEQIDGFRSLVLVRRLLPALGIILLKIKDKSKSHSWDWSLDTLACHLKTISRPQNTGLEGLERLTLDLSPETVESLEFLADLVTFLQPLVQFALSSPKDSENTQRKFILVRFILLMFGHPVSSLSQQPELSKTNNLLYPKSHSICCQLVSFVADLSGDMLSDSLNINRLIKYKESKIDLNYDVAVVTHFYLVFSLEMSFEQIPQIYLPSGILQMISSHLVEAMRSEQELVSYKAVYLLQTLLSRSSAQSLTGDSAQNPAYLDLLEPLRDVVIYHGLSEARTVGFAAFKLLVNVFDSEARYQLYRHLLNTLNHSGLMGWSISHLKDTLLLTLGASPLYSGENLLALLRNLFKLANGAETDLLEISDELIAEINLAVVLLARFPGRLEIDELKSLMKVWSSHIQEALKLSRAHWELKLKTDCNSEAPESTIEVGGRPLPAMEPGQLKAVVNSAISTLDVIQFNLASLDTRLMK